MPVIPEIKFSVPFSQVTTLFLATALKMLSTLSLRALLLAVLSLSSTPEPKLLDCLWSRLGRSGFRRLRVLTAPPGRERIQFDRTCLCITPKSRDVASHKTGGE